MYGMYAMLWYMVCLTLDVLPVLDPHDLQEDGPYIAEQLRDDHEVWAAVGQGHHAAELLVLHHGPVLLGGQQSAYVCVYVCA